MDSAQDAESVAKQIEEYDGLKTLELRGNTVGVEAGERLAQALEMHPELEGTSSCAQFETYTKDGSTFSIIMLHAFGITL
ncbi:hypothetical protein OSTOST_15881 [Ostertagia ostertagi]